MFPNVSLVQLTEEKVELVATKPKKFSKAFSGQQISHICPEQELSYANKTANRDILENLWDIRPLHSKLYKAAAAV